MKNPKRRRRLSDRERDILASIKEAERKERLALNRHLSAICAAVEKPLTKKQLRSAERVRLSRVMSTVTFLPQAWIGYTMPKRGASRARVKICRR
ncbi:MAG: hypothetical protein NVV63_12620 [Opitutus sp.]|nr:hypothetical protein [Opitutus sp.]